MLTSLLASFIMSTVPIEPNVEQLAWMAGDWTCEIWGGTFEETWSEPKGGAMQGMGRHLSDGKTTFMEFMSIEQSGETVTLYMILGAPSKGDKSPVPFKLSGYDGTRAIFERTEDEYPKRIIYSKPVSGIMLCRIEGIQNGEQTSDEFEFRRVVQARLA